MSDILKLDRKAIKDAANWALFEAYLNQRGVRVFQTIQTISISFDALTAADEFLRFIVNARGRK